MLSAVSVLDIEGDVAKIKYKHRGKIRFEPYPFKGAWFSTRGEAEEYVQKMNRERFEENKRKSN